MAIERCPACYVPFALVGRAHRCVPRPAPVAEQVERAAPAPSAALKFLDDAVAQIADDALLTSTMTELVKRGAVIVGVDLIPTKPKRDRAAYMRGYRARMKAAKA
jgi:hypothetical protein